MLNNAKSNKVHYSYQRLFDFSCDRLASRIERQLRERLPDCSKTKTDPVTSEWLSGPGGAAFLTTLRARAHSC